MAKSVGSSEPKKSRFRRRKSGEPNQVKMVFDQTRANDPQLITWMLGSFAIVFVLFLIIGFAIGHPWYLGFIGLLFGVMAAVLVMGRRAEGAAYRSIEGKPGAAGAALSSLRKGWRVDQEPVAAEAGKARQVKDLASAAMIYRAVGRPGVVLVAEGPKGSAEKLIKSEKSRTTRVLGPEVPIHTFRVGNDAEGTAIGDLKKQISKLPKVMTEEETSTVTKRLRALTANRPSIPAGMDPNKVRVNRSAMRGR